MLTAVAAVAVLAGGGVLANELTGADTRTTAEPQHGTSVGTFSGTALPAKVHDLLADATPKARPNITPGGENSPFTPGTPHAPTCVLKATQDPGAAPLAASRGTYEGKVAYLVVLPDSASPLTKVDAYVIDGSCAAHGAAGGAQATVLTRQTYSR